MPSTDARAARNDLLSALAATLLGWALSAPGLLPGTALPTSHEGGLRSDLFDVAIPTMRAASAAWGSGSIPLWFDGAALGLAFGGVPESMASYPPAMLLFAALSPVRAAAWLLLSHALLAGVGAAALARRMGASRPAQCLAATALSLGLWLPDHLRQANLFCAAAWVPATWWALDRCLARPSARAAATLVVCAAMMTLAGHLQVAHHAAVIFAVWCVARVATDASLRASPGRRALALGGAAALAAIVAAPQLALMAEALHLAGRAGSLEHASRFAPQPSMLVSLLHPVLAGDPLHPATPGAVFWEDVAYVGAPALALALSAVVGRARDRAWWPWAAVTAAALCLAFGRRSAVSGWLFAVIPGMSVARFEQRFVWFACVALSVAAARGLDALTSWLRTRGASARALAWAPWLVVALNAATLVDAVRANCPVRDPDGLAREPASAPMLRAAGVDPARPGRRVVGFEPRSLHEHIARVGGFGDELGPQVEGRALMVPQHAAWWGWRTVDGYVGLVPSWVRDGLGDQHRDGVFSRAALALDRERSPSSAARYVDLAAWLGADAVLSPFALPTDRILPVGAVPARYVPTVVARVARPFASAWVATGEACFAGDDDVARALDEDRVDLRTTALRVGSCVAHPGTSVVARWREGGSADRFTVDVASDGDGTLVVSHGYHPRWQVSVDGAPWRSAERVDLLMLGARVHAGRHALRFRFDGGRERVAYGVSLAALALAAVLLARRPRS